MFFLIIGILIVSYVAADCYLKHNQLDGLEAVVFIGRLAVIFGLGLLIPAIEPFLGMQNVGITMFFSILTIGCGVLLKATASIKT